MCNHLKPQRTHQSSKSNKSGTSGSFVEAQAQVDPCDIEKVKRGEDLRTYLCVKNLPIKYTKKELEEEINLTHANKYHRIDLTKAKDDQVKNPGYFFIELKHPLFVITFYDEFQGRTWSKYKSKKAPSICYGNKDNHSKKSHKNYQRNKSNAALSNGSAPSSNTNMEEGMEAELL